MTETLSRLLLRLSEAEHPVLWGRVAAPYFGREFDRLLAQRVLVEDPPADTWAVCSDCDCDLDARPIQEIHGRWVAVCPQNHRADVHLTDEDVRSFRIDPAMLVQLISGTSGLAKDPEAILPGLWNLGLAPSGQAVFAVLAVASAAQPGLMGMMTKSAKGSAITLLVPTRLPNVNLRALDDAGIHVVPIDEALGDDPATPFALRPTMLVPIIAPKLRLDRGRLSVSMYGKDGTLSKRPFDLLVVLAEAGGAVVKRRTIEARLWNQPIAKTAVNDAMRDLREGLAAIDPRTDELIETKAGQGYRIALAPGEIVLTPYAPVTVPEGASFKDMVALKGKSDIGDQINKKIIAPLASANKLSDMPDFNDTGKLGSGKEMVDRLTNLIGIFENKSLDFSKHRAEDDDLLGDAYEYLMRHFATESGKSKGQFYTPAEVSRVMAQIIGIKGAKTSAATTVYDPTCGSGSLLLTDISHMGGPSTPD